MIDDVGKDMGKVWPTAYITELCLQLTAGSRPANGDEHRALGSQSCETALLTMGDLPYLLPLQYLSSVLLVCFFVIQLFYDFSKLNDELLCVCMYV